MQCYGTCDNLGLLTGVVLPLCSDGNIMEYLGDNPSADKLNLVGPLFPRARMMIEVGVSYHRLHQEPLTSMPKSSFTGISVVYVFSQSWRP